MENNCFNKHISDFNLLKLEFNNLIPAIKKLNLKDYIGDSLSDYQYDYIYSNPVYLVFVHLYDLKLLGEKQGFDIFGRDSYIKYLYVAFFEQTLLNMIYCLNEINKCINANPIVKRIRFQHYYNCVATYINSFEMIRSFSPNDIFKIYYYLINEEDPVFFFKNGMLFSFLSAIEDDAALLKLEIQQDMFDYVQSFVVEQEIKKSNEVIDTAKFDEIIEKKSEEYSVDFASLDVGFVYKFGGDKNAQDTSSS